MGETLAELCQFGRVVVARCHSQRDNDGRHVEWLKKLSLGACGCVEQSEYNQREKGEMRLFRCRKFGEANDKFI